MLVKPTPLSILSTGYPIDPHPNVQSAASRSFTHLLRHLESPLHEPSIEAFASVTSWLEERDWQRSAPIILDSGCGTGLSTRKLAISNPDAAVIGVDRSAKRLQKVGDSGRGSTAPAEDVADDNDCDAPLPPNALLVRSELATFWRLMLAAEDTDGALAASRVQQHYLLYPNPYPKPKRLNLRWHGHAALPCLLAIGDHLEMRSNWRTYLEEFGMAAATVGQAASAAMEPYGDSHTCVTGGATASDSAAAASATAARTWEFAARRASLRLGTQTSGGAGTIDELVLGKDGSGALTSFERRYHAAGEKMYRLVLPPISSGGRRRSDRGAVGAMSMSAARGGGDEREEQARRMKDLENELRAVKTMASDAQNAEARLRNMVATAEKNAEMAYSARVEAEEAAEDAQAELDALREVYRMDVTGLEGSVADLEDEVAALKRRLEAASEGAAGGGVTAGRVGVDVSPEEADQAARIEALSEELSEMRTRAMRAEAEAADLGAELEAMQALARIEDEERQGEMEDLRLQLQAAEKNAAAARLGLGDEGEGGDESNEATIRELQEQVAALLEAYQSSEAASTELMQLRPKLAELESELAELKKVVKKDDGAE